VLSSPSPVSFFAQLARTGLALIAVERGDVASARKQYDALRPWRITLTGMNHVCGHRVLGLLARTMGRMDDAVAHFEDSLAFCRKAGARPELAWTSYDHAGSLLQRNEPGDHFRAVSLVDQALSISTELGMRPLVEKVVALKEEAERQDVAVNVPAYPAGLTGREVEVLLLMAKGKTIREIASELVISPRTVQRHTTNLYVKIDARNRAEATAFALGELATLFETPPGR
jgi:DNA-binding CsgD family transcriptional regulator